MSFSKINLREGALKRNSLLYVDINLINFDLMKIKVDMNTSKNLSLFWSESSVFSFQVFSLTCNQSFWCKIVQVSEVIFSSLS